MHKIKKTTAFLFLTLSATVFCPAIAQPTGQSSVFPEEAWGVHSWASYRSNQVSLETCPGIKGAPLLLHWGNLEPRNGDFDFQGQIGDKLVELDQNDFYTFITVWVAFATSQVSETDTTWAMTPRWLFNNGVPLVEMTETINPLGENTRRDSPYFLDEDYKFFYYRMIDSLGNYLINLPENLKRRILFVQSAEGATGDEGPYKGDPVDPAYDIPNTVWSQFRMAAWARYQAALSIDGLEQIPLMTNANLPEHFTYMLDNFPFAIGEKGGMFSHGYHISEAQERLADAIAFRNEVEARGKIYYARGEMDAEYKTYGWSTQNIPQALYWSAIYAVHCGLNIWNLPGEVCQGDTYFDVIDFFNRYAKQKRPEFSKVAFCALRRGLDASDTKSFPESIYGGAVKSNTQRYIDIANDFSEYGASQGDPEKATGGGMKNRQRQDYNDVGWKILTTNYQQNISQIDPEETSIAWWQVDQSIYGRFARGFDGSRGMNTMFFDVDDQYFEGNRLKENGRLKVRVVYKASDGGSWELLYHAKDGSMKTACMVDNDINSGWLTREVFIDDALLDNGGPKGADLILQNLGNTNCRFHLIELERDQLSPSNDTIKVTSVSIEGCPSEIIEGATRQLSASVAPSNAGDQSVYWASSNTGVVTVDEWGLLTAVSSGSAEIFASSGEGSFADTCLVNVVEVLSDQSPFGGTERTIPGFIEGEDFDDGGQHISYYDTDEGLGSALDYRPVTDVDLYAKANGSNGLSVGRTREGEWLEYTVDATEDTYDITLYYYCNSAPGQLEVSLDGTLLVTLSDIENQGDWSIRDSLTMEGVYIAGGENKILRLEFIGGGSIDIDAIRFTAADRIDVSGVAMDGCPAGQLQTGDTHQLAATVLPLDASKRHLSWSSSDSAVAGVDENGRVTALSEGTATISVFTDDGGFTDSCQIQVIAEIPISGITIENCPPEQIVPGKNHQLTAVTSPVNATDQRVTWSTYDASIATVDANGLVTAVSEGTVIISLSAPGGFSDQCGIEIYNQYVAVTAVTIDGCRGTPLEIGHTHHLSVQVIPQDATDQSVSWSSSDNSVASIDENGMITAISEGTVQVTLASNDGGFTDNCMVTVIDTTGTSASEGALSQNAIKVYPNPVTEHLYFEFSETGLKRHIKIHNQKGQLLVAVSSSESRFSIDLKRFRSEKMLFITVVTRSSVSRFKVFTE